MKNIFFIVVMLSLFKQASSFFLVIKQFKKTSFINEIIISMLGFIIMYSQNVEWYFALCNSFIEYFANKIIFLLIILIVKTVAFKLLISFTHNGILSKILFLKGDKRDVYKNLKVLQKIDYGPRLKHGIPAMARKKHGKTQIKFDRKGFPKFHSFYTYHLPMKDWKKSREVHFLRANKALYQKALKSKRVRKLFSRKDMLDLKKGETPNAYTWHHHQNCGKLQLVDRQVHAAVEHVGGYSIWGEKEEN